MKSRPNLINFFYLVSSGLIVQLAGSIYRFWLARTIGPEGLGLLQMVYPVYRLLSGIATIGLPLALSKWVSEYVADRQYSRINSLKNWAVYIVTISSIIITFGLLIFTPFLSRHLFTDPRIQESMYIVAFAIPFSALSAIYRGYFQGFSRMAPTAVSEIIEQAVEITSTFLLMEVFVEFIPCTVFGAPVCGLTFGEIACLLTLIFFLKREPPNYSANALTTELIPTPPYSQIFRYSWPVLLNQIIVSISLASEGVIIPHLLITNGFATSVSTGLFGKLTGMAEPIAYFPLIFLAPLGSVLLPQVSAAFKTKSFYKIQHKISIFYMAAVLLCLISFVLIMFLAAPLSQFLYRDISPTLLIKLMAIGLPFTGISILNISILAAIGATDKILRLSIWGVGLKTFTLFVLTPLFGIIGSSWAINITQIFTCLASLYEVKRFLSKLDA